jgi:hypothetical protein
MMTTSLKMLRISGIKRLSVRCYNTQCGHASLFGIRHWPDDMQLSAISLRLTCSVCGARGGELSPAPALMAMADDGED